MTRVMGCLASLRGRPNGSPAATAVREASTVARVGRLDRPQDLPQQVRELVLFLRAETGDEQRLPLVEPREEAADHAPSRRRQLDDHEPAILGVATAGDQAPSLEGAHDAGQRGLT